MKKKLLFFFIILSIILVAIISNIYNSKTTHYKLFSNNKLAGNTPYANDLKDKIYFFSTNDSDFILVVSNGHYGLVDTSNRYSNKIVDSDGIEYDVPSSEGLSSQTYFGNGKDVAKYMVNALGVDHIDFVIATHAHSDHIGGVEEICQQKLSNGNYLIDNKTHYFYKAYYHMSDVDDDIDGNGNKVSRNGTWHNQAYVYSATKAMQDRGASLINVSNGVKIDQYSQTVFPDISNIQSQDSHLSNATYSAENLRNYYDDYISFQFGNYSIRLYNLFTSKSGLNENVNSILTLITKGESSILLSGDINIQVDTEAILAKEIFDDVGYIDLYKMAHHTNTGSNSKELFDYLQPKYCVATRKVTKNTQSEKSYLVTRFYASKKYNTSFYETGLVDKAVVVTIEDNGMIFNELYDTSNNVDNSNLYNPNLKSLNPRSLDIQNDDYVGWNSWSSYRYDNWMYIEKDSNTQYSVKTEWFKKGDYWYCSDASGLIRRGWQAINGNWYYFAYLNEVFEDGTNYYPEGAMVKGWKSLLCKSGRFWFYLAQSDSDIKKENTDTYYPEGAMVKGWQKMDYGGSNYWFYFARNDDDIDEFPEGAMITGRQYVDYMGNRDFYYFAISTEEFEEYVKGAMVKNKTINGYTYNGAGICTNNDTIQPTITANNITYGEGLLIRLQDNQSGVYGWQIGQNADTPSNEWFKMKNINDQSFTITGLDAGTYYIWVKDSDQNLTSKQVIVAKKPLLVEWNSNSLFVYNGNNQGPTLKNSQIDGINGEVVNLSVEGYQSEIGTNYIATAIISSVVGGQEDKENYELSGNTKIFSIQLTNQLSGDLNDNGQLDSGDIMKIYRHIAQGNNIETATRHPEWKLSDEKITQGDLNKNGRVDMGDVIKIQRYMAANNNPEVAQKHPDWLNI